MTYKSYSTTEQSGPEFGGEMLTVDAPAGCDECSENVTAGHFACSVPPEDLRADLENGKLTREFCDGAWYLAVPTKSYAKDCPDDFVPGKVLRHTVDGNHDAVGGNHPDDLVPCPRCSGTGRVPMVPSDFTDWDEAVPPGVAETAEAYREFKIATA